jgi:KDO2-lipid IV(A) lauroyltransferase
MRAVLIKAILHLCAFLPLPIIHGIGVCIGRGLLLVPNRSRQSSEINIALCWPKLSAREQRALLRNSLRETGKTIIETSALWLRPGKRTLRLIKQVDGHERVEQATEDCVRECPEQYQWSYRRFKTRPDGEASFYK